MADYIEVSIDILDKLPDQRARVRADLRIADLIQEIQREFREELDAAPEQRFHIWRRNASQVLDMGRTLEELKISAGTPLVFGVNIPKQRPIRLSGEYLEQLPKIRSRNTALTGAFFIPLIQQTIPIAATPLVIGRAGRHSNFPGLHRLQIDDRFEYALNVSGDQALILEKDEFFYVYNFLPAYAFLPNVKVKSQAIPTYLNGVALGINEPGEARALLPGDEIRLGETNITLIFQQ